MASGPAVKEEEAARNSQLQLAIELDDVDELYSIIEGYEKLLDYGSEGPFPNTPLHIAAGKGKTNVATEIAILKPSFARKLNPGGHSPMHLALQKKHYHTARALMTLEPELIRVRGRGGITPMHLVAGEKGNNGQENVELLGLQAEFLCACKSSIEDLTSQCETAVHVALKRGNVEAFKVLFGWLRQVYMTEILNWKDIDGNTVLHIAAIERQPEIIMLLNGYVDVHAKNFHGKTALEIFQVNSSSDQAVVKRLRGQERLTRLFTPTLSLPQLFSTRQTFAERLEFIFNVQDKSARDVILIVSTLVATTTYQAFVSPPGGYWQDSSTNPTTNSTVVIANSTDIANGEPHQAGKMILSGSNLYAFTFCNSMAFISSVCIILAAAIPLWPDTFMVCWTMLMLVLTYFFPLAIGLRNPHDARVTLIEGFCILAAYAFFWVSLRMSVKRIQVQKRINATRRRVGNFQGSEDQR